MIRYTRTQHRPPSRQVNDHGRVSGTHTLQRGVFVVLVVVDGSGHAALDTRPVGAAL